VRTKSYHHGNLANALLDAADALLRDHSFAELTLRQVAAAVGVAPSAAYHHFADRNALLDALAARALEALADALDERLARIPKADAQRRLVALGRVYVAWARHQPHRFEAAFGSQQRRPDVPANLRPFKLLGSLLDEAVIRETLPSDARRHGELILWPALHGLAVLASSGPLLEKSEREVAALCDDLVLTILAGLKARTHPAPSDEGGP
jgi:AcrR family transcriptional regulator